jgi:hypothetical protein
MLHGYTNVGLRHLSIEKKTKIYDIIRQHPNYGAKRISTMLKTAKYGSEEISENQIYEELKRAKLNRKSQRELFVKRGGKLRLKPPGTPLLTLDGEVMVGFRSEDKLDKDLLFNIPIPQIDTKSKEKILTAKSSSTPNSTSDDKRKDSSKIVQKDELESSAEKKQDSSLEINKNDENKESVSEEVDEKERKVD